MGLAPPPSMSGLLQGGEAGGGGIGCNSTAVGCLWLAAQAAITFRKTHSRESTQSRNQGDFLLGKLESYPVRMFRPMCLQPPRAVSSTLTVASALSGALFSCTNCQPKELGISSFTLCLTTLQGTGSTCPQKAAACRGSQPSQSFTSTRTPWSRRSSAARRYPLAPAMCSWKRGKKSK